MDNKIIKLGSDLLSNKDDDRKIKLLKYINKKSLKIIILIFLAVVVSVILLGFGNNSKSNVNEDSYKTSYYQTTLEYCAELESKLQSVISKIDGAGDVCVMLSVVGSPELIYANKSDETNSSNPSGTISSSNSSSPIIVNVGGQSSALILTEKLPEVKGVIVVSSGAGNVAVKLNILQAVSTLLNLDSDKISVLKGI